MASRVLNLGQLRKRLAKMDPRVAGDSLVPAARLFLVDAERDLQVNKLRKNPPYLRVQSGRLSQSVVTDVVRLPTGAGAVMGTNVVYAKAHEFGFQGTVTVRAHTRLGRQVRAHSRVMRLKERKMFRHAMRDTAPRARLYTLAALRHLVETGEIPSLSDVRRRAL